MDRKLECADAADNAELQPERQSRRTLLRRLSFAGAGVVLVPLLTACGGGDDEEEDDEEEEEDD